MGTTDVKRRQIQSAVLEWMYRALAESSGTRAASPNEGDIEGFEWRDVQYELRRLEGDGFIEGEHLKQLTARGLEYLQDLGAETALDGDLRERILAALYELDREQGRHARVSATKLSEELSEAESTVAVVLHYLEDSGFVEVQSTMGNRFRGVRITDRGMTKHEAIENAGGGWASSTTSPTDSHEFVFGPNEEAEADRLLRNVTEVARDEILIVDPYARAGIISKLQHVPRGVEVKILTSDRMSGEDYGAELQQFPDLKVAIRALARAHLQFHDRYVVVDAKDAWAWGHSFHDGGKTKHTVAQLRPVNRDRILVDFQAKWSAGQVLV